MQRSQGSLCKRDGRIFGRRAESFARGDNSDNNNTGDDAAWVREISTTIGDDDAPIQSSSPKHHRTTRGELGQKKSIELTLPMMVIIEEVAVQFATDLLASMLPTTLAQEDVLAHSSSDVGASYIPVLSFPECTTMLPPTSGMGALLDTIIAPPSSPTTRLVSTGKTRFMSPLLFIHIS